MKKSVGQIIIINVKDQDGKVVENAKIEVLEGKEFITIDGNKISLNGKGHVKIQISKEGYNSYETEFDINEAVLLKLNVSFEGKLFHGETIKTVVKDEIVQEIIDKVTKTLSSGNVGDGKIFVSDIEEAYTISEETREDED